MRCGRCHPTRWGGAQVRRYQYRMTPRGPAVLCPRAQTGCFQASGGHPGCSRPVRLRVDVRGVTCSPLLRAGLRVGFRCPWCGSTGSPRHRPASRLRPCGCSVPCLCGGRVRRVCLADGRSPDGVTESCYITVRTKSTEPKKRSARAATEGTLTDLRRSPLA